MNKITINTHSSICINDDIYFDPYNIAEKKKNAKAIFITHSHYDHLDIPSIHNLFNSDTVIVAPEDCISTLREEGFLDENLKQASPNQTSVVYDVSFNTFASYNIGKRFHPKLNNWVGYTVNINGVLYTVCGDSDLTEELKNIKTDVLFVPIGGTYTMDIKEGATLTNTIKPKVAIPVHYGSIVGKITDGERFAKLIDKNITVNILIK